MTFKDSAIQIIMNKIQSVASQQREVEDIYKKFSIDPKGEKDYVALEAYKMALADILKEIRSINDKPASSSNFRSKKGGGSI